MNSIAVSKGVHERTVNITVYFDLDSHSLMMFNRAAATILMTDRLHQGAQQGTSPGDRHKGYIEGHYSRLMMEVRINWEDC